MGFFGNIMKYKLAKEAGKKVMDYINSNKGESSSKETTAKHRNEKKY